MTTIDEYIAGFPVKIQKLLSQMRTTIKSVVPEAEEAMKYGMPTFRLHGNLVHFAAYKNHIGFYPAPAAIIAFKDEISVYKNSKGAIQFPIHQELPIDLIIRIVVFRSDENIRKSQAKKVNNVKLQHIKNIITN